MQIAYGASGIVLFFIFLFATFPYANALSGVLAPMGLRLSSKSQRFAFPLGISMEAVALDAPDGRRFFQSDWMRVAPSIPSLLLGAPGVKVSAAAYGGDLDVRARRSADITALSFNAANLHLERYQALRAIGLDLEGVVSGDGEVYISQRDLLDDHGVIHLAASGAGVRVFPGTPLLKIGSLTAAINLEKGKLNINPVQSRGGDLTISGRGVIELDLNLPDSAVAIKFTLEVSPTARRRLGILLNFLPHPPSATMPYFLHGTLGSPQLS